MQKIRMIVLFLVVMSICVLVSVLGEVRIGDRATYYDIPVFEGLETERYDNTNTFQAINFVTADSMHDIEQDALLSSATSAVQQLRVDFSAAPTSGRVPLMVQFIDLSTGGPSQWVWDFGDENAAEVQNPIHTYMRSGIYSVSLTVFGMDGSSGTKVKEGYVTVNPVPLQAGFTAVPDKGKAPLTVQFTDTSVGAMIWYWDFGDGASSMIPNPTHTYQQEGTYSARLTVSNGLGESDTAKMNIEVMGSEIINADFSAEPRSGYAPLTVAFVDLSDGTPAMWLWDFGDSATDSAQNPVHTYTRVGTYPVSLTVSDQYGSDTEQKNDYIQVLEESPVTGTIPLSSGWNFISVPKKLAAGKDTAAIFEHINVDGHSAFRYDSAMMKWIPLSRTTIVSPLDGIWLYSKYSDEVALAFDSGSIKIPSVRELKQGWNAIGITGFEPRQAVHALLTVQNVWVYCLGFNNVYQRYDEMIIKGQNDYINLNPYHGYWIYLTSDGKLTM